MLLGASLLCLGRSVRGADLTALLAALIAGLALLGYLFDVPALRRGLSSPLTPMALPTALAMLALSAGLLAATRDSRCSRAAAGPAARCCAGSRRRPSSCRSRSPSSRSKACATTGSTSAKGSRCSAPR